MADSKVVLDVPDVNALGVASKTSAPNTKSKVKQDAIEKSAIEKVNVASASQESDSGAEQELERVREEAYQKGLQAGIKQGIEKGIEQAEEAIEERHADALQSVEQLEKQLSDVLMQLSKLMDDFQQQKEAFDGKVNQAAFSISSKLISDLFMTFIADEKAIQKSIDLMVAEYFGDLNVQVYLGKRILKQISHEDHPFLTSSNIGDWEIELSRKGQTILIDYQNYFLKLSELLK